MYVLMYVPIYFVENDLSYVLYNEPKRMEYIERFPLTFPTAIFLFGSQVDSPNSFDKYCPIL